jgi:carboxyl-terminal processing protease
VKIALLTLVAFLAAAALPVRAASFDAKMAARVFEAALAFAAPRTLDPVSPGDLTLWGLHGITALDPALTTLRDGGVVRLKAGDHVLMEKPAPPQDDAAGWARLASALEQAAFDSSAVLRRAGAQALIQGFFDEAFNHIDPYTRYVAPAPAEDERDKLSIDATAGLGLIRQGHAVVINDLVPGGPGARSGLRVGDHVLAVDGRAVSGMRPARVQTLLTGAAGTDHRLRVRGLDGATRTHILTLDYVPPETVFPRREGELLVIRIGAFVANTAERLSQALEAGLVSGKPVAAVVIDLRGNRGGLLRQAVTCVALLAEQGVIASTAGRDREAMHDWRIDGGGDLTHGLKVIVLVDGRTASAAEVMAAALADLGRAVVVGSSTLGKGLVQTITRLPDSGELFVTWSRILAPRGWPIQSIGVLPHLCTSQGEDETKRKRSPPPAPPAPRSPWRPHSTCACPAQPPKAGARTWPPRISSRCIQKRTRRRYSSSQPAPRSTDVWQPNSVLDPGRPCTQILRIPACPLGRSP